MQSPFYPEPPNIQLNLSTDQFEPPRWRKKHEILLVALTAVILQMGVIGIAAVTAFQPATRDALGTQLKAYGFPSYVAGSVCLCIGMAICSLCIEKSTTEFSWNIRFPNKTRMGQNNSTNSNPNNQRAKDKTRSRINCADYPRLIFLQKGQKVQVSITHLCTPSTTLRRDIRCGNTCLMEYQDMKFDPYVILAGPKRYIVTSNRMEEVLQKSVSQPTIIEQGSNRSESSSPDHKNSKV